ncbi:DUF6520 family protein [Mucilaginibacter sp. UR6-1]|uniref:DUF6520 family protein n=1 Tax=Mucilaginibacter sp. UR6-1 TaxID=1435643 RepID=UPI001E60DB1F|nr:DUF6520 family protein [Mucilaginibacter sp. UR6-1]MCC8407731.1 DUF6520 family protein [Mucilaginibacter sp. UR6-1]
MKKLIIPVIAIILAFGSSAFTAKKSTSNFFKYIGPAARTSGDVQSITNYQAQTLDPCADVENVCGVTLPTAKTVGQNPASTEFNAEKSNLWTSQQNHSPADDAIGMEP